MTAAKSQPPFELRVFILAKNEEANIRTTLEAALDSGVSHVTVLDSGSTDSTIAIASEYRNVHVSAYRYQDHCSAYNEIALRMVPFGEWFVVLDADMKISSALVAELSEAASTERYDAAMAPVDMWWEGAPLKRGSVLRPKAMAFRAGRQLFVPEGHAERLLADRERVYLCRHAIVHDDRKDYSAWLVSQLRYSRAMLARDADNASRMRDKLYLHTPVMVLAQPFVSLVVRRGLMSGRVGLVYAADRMIASLIALRTSVASKIQVRQGSRGTE